MLLRTTSRPRKNKKRATSLTMDHPLELEVVDCDMQCKLDTCMSSSSFAAFSDAARKSAPITLRANMRAITITKPTCCGRS
eukprot:5017688-Amphidinium_carterae.1